MRNEALQRSLRRRGMTHAKLAAAAGLNRSVVTRMLACRPGERYQGQERGKETRVRLFPHLTGEEIDHLGWGKAIDEWLERPAKQVEQCST